MATVSSPYPVKLSIDYPDRNLNRLTTFFRILTIIPIAIIINLLSGEYYSQYTSSWEPGWQTYFSTGALVFIPLVLMILFRQKYPRWWFDWNLALTRFGCRIMAYLALLRDEYPSTDEEQAVHIEIAYPDVKKELNRWLPLIKWFLAIPHYFVLWFLVAAAVIVVIIAWFAILFNGRYPKELFDFVAGIFRWVLRVYAYAFLLTTDRYPPFRLGE